MTSLKDYISKENNEIVEQFRYFNRLDKILKNLSKKSQHEEMKISKCNHDVGHHDDDENIPAKNKSPSADHKNETPKNQKDDDQTKTNLDLEKMMENLPILNTPKSAPSKPSQMEKYRQDLLKQIQEKKISKKTNEELEKNKEKILQNKIKQQQISLYLEYLDERKKMKNFIPKQRPPSSSTKIMMAENDRKNAIQMKQKCKSAKADHHRKHEKDANEKNNINSLNDKMDIPNDDDDSGGVGGGEQSSSNDSLMKIQEKESSSTTNILTDLNEVRKIMHNDHYEFVGKII
ncbi:uncharacterized protein LOC142645963 [Dermatophagoides pteronyssinus]|uniref:uncharacterized protein LOC142645963 n=1 Tax=Dermatophagoides pteronyssinus TaxID=6956 RepID=UPI003F672560